MKSLMGRPNTHWAGESLVLGSGCYDIVRRQAGVSLLQGSHVHLYCQ